VPGGSAHTIGWHEGDRTPLRPLFEQADDSSTQIDASIDMGGVLVARDEAGTVVGHLQVVHAGPDTVEIASMAVEAESRKQGVGRRLVERALAVSREAGARRISVATATADIGNLRFYQRCGFRATAIERDAFTPRNGYACDLAVDGIPVRDAIRFELELDGVP
jgi:predicted N-acetyltransferase YhbS